MLGKTAGLKMSRTDVPVGLLQGEVKVGVLHHEFCLGLPVALTLEFRIKMGIESLLVVKELLIAKQGRVRPNRLEEKSFTPAWVSTDQIWRKPLALELLRSTDATLSPDDLGFRFNYQRMNPLGVAAI